MKITLKIGEEISIILSNNYTTGYSWNFNEQTDIVEIQRNTLDTKNTPIMFGAPLTELVKFKALSRGDIVYKFKAYWQTNDMIENEKTIEIEVI